MTLQLDADGHLVNHLDWSIENAQQLADTLEVTLTEEHYAVLMAVRAYYDQFGHHRPHAP